MDWRFDHHAFYFCADVDECSAAVQSDRDICNNALTRRICSNTVGGFDCACPTGSELTGGICGKFASYRNNMAYVARTCRYSG